MKILINNKKQDKIKAFLVNDYWVIIDTSRVANEGEFNLSSNFEILKVEFNKLKIYGKGCHPIIASTKFINKDIPIIKFINNKKYTKKQLKRAIEMAFDMAEYGISNSLINKYKNKIIKSLNSSKTPSKVNLKMEGKKLKTKSNSKRKIIEIKV
jgi:hypothetical protein